MGSTQNKDRLTERVVFRVTAEEKARFFHAYQRAERAAALRRLFVRLVRRGETTGR